jgi:DNA-binding PadR family transcriptional regulator
MRRHHFHILMSLAAEDRHGSAIMRDVLALTDGTVRLWPVTLYGALDQLVDDGLIRGLTAAPPGAEADSGHTRWFKITAAGRRALAAELAALERMVQHGQRRLAPRGGA